VEGNAFNIEKEWLDSFVPETYTWNSPWCHRDLCDGSNIYINAHGRGQEGEIVSKNVALLAVVMTQEQSITTVMELQNQSCCISTD
jgi:hypothetical protein